MRFNELERHLPTMTHATLSKQLKRLEADGLIVRTVYPQIPPKVEYSLSPIGCEFVPVLDEIRIWGEKYLDYIEYARRKEQAASSVVSPRANVG